MSQSIAEERWTNPKETKANIFRNLNETLHKKVKIHPGTLKQLEDVLTSLDGEIYKTNFDQVWVDVVELESAA